MSEVHVKFTDVEQRLRNKSEKSPHAHAHKHLPFTPKPLTVHSGCTFFFYQYVCVHWELNPQPFALLTQCEPQESLSQTISKVKNRFHTGKASKFTLDIFRRKKGSKISLLFLFIIGVMTTGCSDSVPQFMCLRTTQQRDTISLIFSRLIHSIISAI